MAAAAIRSWADLNSELLVSIAAAADNGLSIQDYQCLRGVCSAWRSALAPPYPCMLSLADDGGRSASVFSLPMRRSFNLYTASEPLYEGCREGRNRKGSRVRVVGSGHGRLAVAVDHGDLSYRMHGHVTVSGWRTVRILFLDPVSGRGVYGELPPPPTSMDDHKCVPKVVFTTPDAGRGTVVATCNISKVSYIDTRSANMAWTTVDVVGHTRHLTDLAFDAGGGKLYCLDSCGVVHVLGIPHNCEDPAAPMANDHTLTRLPAVFPAPYDAAFALTRTKHLFFCHGSLYQIWQNTIAAIIKLPSGFRIHLDEIYVVRYDPGRWPAWEVVKDLGGSSVFVGRNSNPAVVRAAGTGAAPGVRPNCVYWINWQRVPMVCDVATGASEPFVALNGVCNGDCWYFDDESTSNNCDEPGAPIARSIILHLQAISRELRTSLLF
ncbi:hypothetical protein VPH35_026533 [Triticum aestivum]